MNDSVFLESYSVMNCGLETMQRRLTEAVQHKHWLLGREADLGRSGWLAAIWEWMTCFSKGFIRLAMNNDQLPKDDTLTNN